MKKSEILPFAAAWMDLEKNHTKWSKPDRERQIFWDHLYVESKKNTNEFIYKTETDSQT